MTMKTLRKLMGTAGAGIDESYRDDDQLYDLLKALAEGLAVGPQAHQDTVATATIGGFIVDGPGTLVRLRASVGTTGTAGDTDVQVHLNGVSKAEVTIDNADADGTKVVSADLAVDVVAGDLIELVVSAAPTGGANLDASAYIYPVDVE